MVHYYDEWNSEVSREEILRSLELERRNMNQLQGFIEDVNRDFEKGISEYAQRSLRFDLVDLGISLKKVTKEVDKLENLLEKYDAGGRVEGWDLT